MSMNVGFRPQVTPQRNYSANNKPGKQQASFGARQLWEAGKKLSTPDSLSSGIEIGVGQVRQFLDEVLPDIKEKGIIKRLFGCSWEIATGTRENGINIRNFTEKHEKRTLSISKTVDGKCTSIELNHSGTPYTIDQDPYTIIDATKRSLDSNPDIPFMAEIDSEVDGIFRDGTRHDYK